MLIGIHAYAHIGLLEDLCIGQQCVIGRCIKLYELENTPESILEDRLKIQLAKDWWIDYKSNFQRLETHT